MCRCVPLVSILALLVGCGQAPKPLPEAAAPVPPVIALPGSDYRAEASGSVAGLAAWSGPTVPRGMTIGATPKGEGYDMKPYPDAFALSVDSATKGLADVLVTVALSESNRWKAWPYPSAKLTARNYRLSAFQGDQSTTGPLFVRRGETLAITSEDPELHVFRGRGASFFSITFPKPMTRTIALDQPGIVEITSGSGYHWLAHDVAVSDHPYVAVTDDRGRFRIDGLPPGECEVTLRLRNPTILNRERDPETGLYFRTNYAPATMKTMKVTIAAGRVTDTTTLFSPVFPSPEPTR